MNGFALFRLPYQQTCTWLEGPVQEFLSCAELNGQSGFVVAPFQVATDQPILLIHPEESQQLSTEKPTFWTEKPFCLHLSTTDRQVLRNDSDQGISVNRSYYHIDFANFHAQLQSGEFQKIVLARCSEEPKADDVSPFELFQRACQNYPRLFIALVFTPQSGLWLTATPEILLEGQGHTWKTIALAGTMKLTEEEAQQDVPAVSWSIKNIQEQRFVATYITECLEQFTNNFSEEGPYTARAANLVHLRSDFHFTLDSNERIGNLLATLHPTPAVCGLPKRQTYQFITRNEHTPRRYYSGFMGMLQPAGDTHLYVSLRCMEIGPSAYRLYAGGGLLKDSVEEQEWQETEAKLETMRRCIATRKTSTF